ncbi:MAG: hypothetical protein ACK2UH_04425 [Candidatus Promineifilaceae bacterium]|jgi:hypothetical protein
MKSKSSWYFGDCLPASVRRRAAGLPGLLLALLLAACVRGPAADNTLAVPTRPPGSAITPLATEAELAPATATGAPLPAATATLAIAEAMTSSPAPEECPFDWFFQPAPDACPAARPTISAAAEQPFENGVMIWLEATDSITVFRDDGRWQRYEDTWTEGEPESDPDIVSPEGRFQPIRGFGKLWRQRPEVREALGWALGVELGFESTFQDQAPTPDRPPQTYLRTYNGQVFALIGRAPDQGEWVVAADNR